MADRTHQYQVTVRWTGNTGSGTSNYRDFERTHEILAADRLPLIGTADPAFRGRTEHWSPEDLLVAALSGCHMLSYLALCAINGVTVTAYEDAADATMVTGKDESGTTAGRFSEAVLRPVVTVAETDMVQKATELHERAHRACFVANSMNFPVRNEPEIRVRSTAV